MKIVRQKLKSIIFGTDTRIGKLFDEVLIVAIILSIVTVLLDSVSEYNNNYGTYLHIAEWIFTILFTVEYLLRMLCIRRPWSYVFSFFGIVDFLSIIPTYLSLFFPGTQVLSVIRILRVLRIFRILKLVKYIGEANLLLVALISSKRKIFIFFFVVLNVVIVLGSLMYLIEGEKSGYTSILISIYWAIVTMTTVGYGDIVPITSLGQVVSSLIMLLGYSMLAVPTGIITSELSSAKKDQKETASCVVCEADNLDINSQFCFKCGSVIEK
tara:strand:+ start:5475 stop:6281 length:807 start_codon:yes stop_codon:yes gene_type:complete